MTLDHRSIFVVIAAVAATFGSCLTATFAQHSGDVILDIQNGQVVTGAVGGDGQVTWPNHLWTRNLGGTFPNFTDHPGFDSLSGTFTQGTTVGITIRKALRVWNTDEAHFNDIADPETMTIEVVSMIETPSEDPGERDSLPSLNLATAGASGIIHVHPLYGLTQPHSPGVYLLELEVWANAAGVGNSDPFWVVFNQDMPDAVVGDALAWVEGNLVPSPCPADITGSGVIDVFDLLEVIGAWGPCDVCADCPADITGDCDVDVFDLLEVIANWGPCP